MKHKLRAIFLVAGTCIGSGMIALPMVLAKLGLIYSFLIMAVVWWTMYYTSLVNLELNLQAGRGLTLGELGRLFSGKIAEAIGVVSLKILSYALLSLFLYGSASILESFFDLKHSIDWFITLLSLIFLFLFLLPYHFLDRINHLLFLGLLFVIFILIGGLTSTIDWSNLPLFPFISFDLFSISNVLPVIFTSFGFQVIFHTLTNACQQNSKTLKTVFFWGSLLPAIIYLIWTFSVLIVVYNQNPIFYEQMAKGTIEVGDLIEELSRIAKWDSIQKLVWLISLLAIFTSIIGVGIGLCDSLKTLLFVSRKSTFLHSLIASFFTIFPSFIVAIFVPNAFIKVLGFAGMILAIIAILLPIFLLEKIKKKDFFYQELRNNTKLTLCVIVGVLVIISQILDMS